jgi:hypothetical protein
MASYSDRSAASGSMRVARLAGTQAASPATAWRGWRASQDRSSPAASLSSPSAPQIGIAGSLLLLRSLGTLLFGVTPYDVPTSAIVVVLLGAIAALASYLPARRTARIEPLTALRQEEGRAVAGATRPSLNAITPRLAARPSD